MDGTGSLNTAVTLLQFVRGGRAGLCLLAGISWTTVAVGEDRFITQPAPVARVARIGATTSPVESPRSALNVVLQPAKPLKGLDSSLAGEEHPPIAEHGVTWVKRGTVHSAIDLAAPHTDSRSDAGNSLELAAPAKAHVSHEPMPATRPIEGAQLHSLTPPPPNPALRAVRDPLVGLESCVDTSAVPVEDLNLSNADNSFGEPEQSATSLHRFQLASKVSRQILGQDSVEQNAPVEPINAAAGWDWMGARLADHLGHSQRLSNRGVFLSAREECDRALVLLARHLDHVSNRFASEPGFHAAQTALRESADFTSIHHAADVGVLKQIVHSHDTPVLKQSDLYQVSPVTLSQHYYQFAESQMIEASQMHPWFSDILYAMGRTFQAEAEVLGGPASDQMRGKAMVYYRAALAIVPQNSLAANQAGFMLLQQGRNREAHQYLLASADASPDTPALQNLVESSRRLGDRPVEQWALQALATLHHGQSVDSRLPAVELLDTSAFMAISPRTIGPWNAAGPTAAATQDAAPRLAVPSTGAATSSVPSVPR